MSNCNKENEKWDDLDDLVIPVVTYSAVPYAALFPLFWIPFAFTKIGFPVYSLYVWPICVLVWLIVLIVAHNHLGKKAFERFVAISAVACIFVQIVLTFYLSYPDL